MQHQINLQRYNHDISLHLFSPDELLTLSSTLLQYYRHHAEPYLFRSHYKFGCDYLGNIISTIPASTTKSNILPSSNLSKNIFLGLSQQDFIYRVYLIEILASQTQISRATECLRKILQKYPTLASLHDDVMYDHSKFTAFISEATVGIGYYSRIQSIIKCLQTLCQRAEGNKKNIAFPNTTAALRELDGVGPYIANAIMCFGYGANLPPMDTNLYHILTRLAGIHPALLLALKLENNDGDLDSKDELLFNFEQNWSPSDDYSPFPETLYAAAKPSPTCPPFSGLNSLKRPRLSQSSPSSADIILLDTDDDENNNNIEPTCRTQHTRNQTYQQVPNDILSSSIYYSIATPHKPIFSFHTIPQAPLHITKPLKGASVLQTSSDESDAVKRNKKGPSRPPSHIAHINTLTLRHVKQFVINFAHMLFYSITIHYPSLRLEIDPEEQYASTHLASAISQALMDVARDYCAHEKPFCGSCPLKQSCRSFRHVYGAANKQNKSNNEANQVDNYLIDVEDLYNWRQLGDEVMKFDEFVKSTYTISKKPRGRQKSKQTKRNLSPSSSFAKTNSNSKKEAIFLDSDEEDLGNILSRPTLTEIVESDEDELLFVRKTIRKPVLNLQEQFEAHHNTVKIASTSKMEGVYYESVSKLDNEAYEEYATRYEEMIKSFQYVYQNLYHPPITINTNPQKCFFCGDHLLLSYNPTKSQGNSTPTLNPKLSFLFPQSVTSFFFSDKLKPKHYNNYITSASTASLTKYKRGKHKEAPDDTSQIITNHLDSPLSLSEIYHYVPTGPSSLIPPLKTGSESRPPQFILPQTTPLLQKDVHPHHNSPINPYDDLEKNFFPTFDDSELFRFKKQSVAREFQLYHQLRQSQLEIMAQPLNVSITSEQHSAKPKGFDYEQVYHDQQHINIIDAYKNAGKQYTLSHIPIYFLRPVRYNFLPLSHPHNSNTSCINNDAKLNQSFYEHELALQRAFGFDIASFEVLLSRTLYSNNITDVIQKWIADNESTFLRLAKKHHQNNDVSVECKQALPSYLVDIFSLTHQNMNPASLYSLKIDSNKDDNRSATLSSQFTFPSVHANLTTPSHRTSILNLFSHFKSGNNGAKTKSNLPPQINWVPFNTTFDPQLHHVHHGLNKNNNGLVNDENQLIVLQSCAIFLNILTNVISCRKFQVVQSELPNMAATLRKKCSEIFSTTIEATFPQMTHFIAQFDYLLDLNLSASIHQLPPQLVDIQLGHKIPSCEETEVSTTPSHPSELDALSKFSFLTTHYVASIIESHRSNRYKLLKKWMFPLQFHIEHSIDNLLNKDAYQSNSLYIALLEAIPQVFHNSSSKQYLMKVYYTILLTPIIYKLYLIMNYHLIKNNRANNLEKITFPDNDTHDNDRMNLSTLTMSQKFQQLWCLFWNIPFVNMTNSHPPPPLITTNDSLLSPTFIPQKSEKMCCLHPNNAWNGYLCPNLSAKYFSHPQTSAKTITISCIHMAIQINMETREYEILADYNGNIHLKPYHSTTLDFSDNLWDINDSFIRNALNLQVAARNSPPFSSYFKQLTGETLLSNSILDDISPLTATTSSFECNNNKLLLPNYVDSLGRTDKPPILLKDNVLTSLIRNINVFTQQTSDFTHVGNTIQPIFIPLEPTPLAQQPSSLYDHHNYIHLFNHIGFIPSPFWRDELNLDIIGAKREQFESNKIFSHQHAPHDNCEDDTRIIYVSSPLHFSWLSVISDPRYFTQVWLPLSYGRHIPRSEHMNWLAVEIDKFHAEYPEIPHPLLKLVDNSDQIPLSALNPPPTIISSATHFPGSNDDNNKVIGTNSPLDQQKQASTLLEDTDDCGANGDNDLNRTDDHAFNNDEHDISEKPHSLPVRITRSSQRLRQSPHMSNHIVDSTSSSDCNSEYEIKESDLEYSDDESVHFDSRRKETKKCVKRSAAILKKMPNSTPGNMNILQMMNITNRPTLSPKPLIKTPMNNVDLIDSDKQIDNDNGLLFQKQQINHTTSNTVAKIVSTTSHVNKNLSLGTKSPCDGNNYLTKVFTFPHSDDQKAMTAANNSFCLLRQPRTITSQFDHVIISSMASKLFTPLDTFLRVLLDAQYSASTDGD